MPDIPPHYAERAERLDGGENRLGVARVADPQERVDRGPAHALRAVGEVARLHRRGSRAKIFAG